MAMKIERWASKAEYRFRRAPRLRGGLVDSSQLPDSGAAPSDRWMYGSGDDGDLTVAADTVMTAGQNILQYHDVTIAQNKTLRNHVDDWGMILYVSGTLTLNSGSRLYAVSGQLTGGAGAGPSPTAPHGGAGRDGGGPGGFLRLFARTIAGSGRIGGGVDANSTTSADAGIADGHGGPGSTGGTYSNNIYAMGRSTATGTGWGTGGVGGGAGADSGANATADWANATYKRTVLNLAGHFHILAYWGSAPSDDFRYGIWRSGAGGGGGSGNESAGATHSFGGEGGSGGGAFGVGGKAQGQVDTNPGGNSSAGGGGGGGGGGPFVVVYCESIDSGVTLSAKGGAGSGGGNGTVGSIGANGAGGGGGVLIAAVPASYTGTSTAAGGDKGGTGAEDGGAGYKRILQKDAA